MADPHPARPRFAFAAVAVSLLVPTVAGAAPGEKPLAFEVTYDAKVRPGPISARVYVMFGPARGGRGEPREGPNWFRPQPIFAVEAKGWKPGEPLRVGEGAVGFPGPMSELKPGRYAIQAVVRLNPDTYELGSGEGNAYGPVVVAEIDPEAGGTVALMVDRVVPPKRLEETDRIKLVDLPSPMLSAFHKRPIRHRAAVILPEGGTTAGRLPTLYIIPGFGGDHRMAKEVVEDPRLDFGARMIRVVLDPDCGTGHHVFADSATNGPRGRALVEELIPHIEATFPALAEPRARLLTGHSSGGWSSLWLQVRHPDTFGGVWSTSPDPVDFRDFQRIDLYKPGENMFRDAEGRRRPIARIGTRAVLFYDDFSRLEEVLGDGGQLGSFEAVFSPLGPDGRPRRLWDRATGAVDTETAHSWEPYDIRLVLERHWPTLGPKLAGKLHVHTGSLDTFFLEGAVELLATSLERLGSDAVVEVHTGKDHMNLLSPELAARIDREMSAAVGLPAKEKQAEDGRAGESDRDAKGSAVASPSR